MDQKTWKLGEHFPVKEKSGNFEQTRKSEGIFAQIAGKSEEIFTKSIGSQEILPKILEK